MKRTYTYLFILATVLYIVLVCMTNAHLSEFDAEKLVYFSDGWTLEGMDNKIRIDDINTRLFEDNTVLIKQLPDNLTDNDSICFGSRNITVKVYVDDREIYFFEPKDNFTGKGYGNSFHEALLRGSDSGHTIRIEFWGVKGNHGRITGVYIGKAEDYIHMSIIKRALPALVSVIIAFLGLVMIAIYFIIPDKENMPYNILALGAVALLIGIWMLLDTNIMQLLTGYLYIWRGLSRSIVMLAAFPCVVFFNSITRQKRNIFVHLAFWFDIITIIILLITRFVLNVDLMVSFSVTIAILSGGTVILMTAILIDNSAYCKANGLTAGIKDYYPGMIVFVICCITDVVMYLFGIYIGDSYGIFSCFGLVLFIALSLKQFLGWWTKDRADIERDRLINRALQYAVSSESPEKSIALMLDFMGNELKTKRICIFEDQGDGRYRGSYEWFAEGLDTAGIDMIYLPYEGLIDELYKSFKANGGILSVSEPEEYRTVNAQFYNIIVSNNIRNLVAGPLESNGTILGLIAFINAPEDSLEDISKIISLISYFINQQIIRRGEQERLRYFSYNDALSGALNRRAFNEYLLDGLDTTGAFGFYICHINGFDEANRKYGYEKGDKMIKETVACMTEVFGKGRVYRLGAAEFAAFGFETDETFFNSDADRVSRLVGEKDLSLAVGAVYCSFGTMDMDKVIKHANKMMRDNMKIN